MINAILFFRDTDKYLKHGEAVLIGGINLAAVTMNITHWHTKSKISTKKPGPHQFRLFLYLSSSSFAVISLTLYSNSLSLINDWP